MPSCPLTGAMCVGLLAWGLFATPVARCAPSNAPGGLQGLEQVTLNSGLRVVVGKLARPTYFSEVLLVVRAGSGVAPAGREELANVAAEALLAGRRASAADPVRVELARLGVSADYAVGREVVVFRFAAPARSASAFLHLLADLLAREPDEEAWTEARARVAQNLARQRADLWQYGWKQLNDLVWSGGDPSSSGAAPTRPAAVDRAALADFRDRTYAPNNMILSVWGEGPAASLTDAVTDPFSRLHRSSKEPPARTIAEPVRRPGTMRCLRDPGANPAVLLVGVGAEVASDQEFYGWQLVAHILGASYNSRLQRRLRTESQVVYTVEAAVVPVGARGVLLRVVGQTDQLDTAHHVIMEELRRLLRAPVTAEEFDYARALLRSRLRLDAASLRDQFYRRSLVMLSHQHIRDPAIAESLLDAFTPDSLHDLLVRSFFPDAASAVVLSRRSEPICEARHDATP